MKDVARHASQHAFSLALLLAAAGGCREQAPAPAPPPTTPAVAPAPTPPPSAPAPATDGDAYFALIEPHFQRVSIYAGPDKFLEEHAKTPEKARHLLAAHWGVAEISHGGFRQLFTSSVGMLVPEAIAALRALGLNENAAIMEEASMIFGKTYPRAHDQRRRALDAYERKAKNKAASVFTALDERFFAALKQHPGGFDAVAAAYARGGV